jgi:hypothetical protein
MHFREQNRNSGMTTGEPRPMGCEREAKIKGDRPPAQNTSRPRAGALRRADNDEQHGAPQRTRPAEAAIRHPLARCFEPSGGFKSGNCRSEVYRSRFTCPTREASCVNEFPPPSDEAFNACLKNRAGKQIASTFAPRSSVGRSVSDARANSVSANSRSISRLSKTPFSRMATSKAARTI